MSVIHKRNAKGRSLVCAQVVSSDTLREILTHVQPPPRCSWVSDTRPQGQTRAQSGLEPAVRSRDEVGVLAGEGTGWSAACWSL